nr:immunoglobulin light chain junction region [Macaca mulatta]
CIQTLQTPYSF